jgi:hypothetical protein
MNKLKRLKKALVRNEDPTKRAKKLLTLVNRAQRGEEYGKRSS